MPVVSVSHVFFQDNSVASTAYLYLNSSTRSTSESATAGELLVSGYTLKTFQVDVPVMSASVTAIYYQVEGRISPILHYAPLYTASIPYSSSGVGKIFSISDNVDYLRVGLKRTGGFTASPVENSVSVVAYFGES